MIEKIKKTKTRFTIQPERRNFLQMLAKNPNYFGNIPKSKIKSNFKMQGNISYEEISCLGYNPSTQILEATFDIKRSYGYSGDLCTSGSIEYVRFYIDFHDGAGWIDQGVSAVNVHDIPEEKDCHKQSTMPLTYTASLKKKTNKYSNCSHPVLPRVRAILSWNIEPPAESPYWMPVWGNVKEADIQLKPYFLFYDDLSKLKYSELLNLATLTPDISLKQLAEVSDFNFSIDELKPVPKTLSLSELYSKYKRADVDPSRFAYKATMNMIKYPVSDLTLNSQKVLKELKIDYTKLIDKFSIFPLKDKSKANVQWEELECLGLDYNTESLVATIKIKKKSGYSGDLCDDGSKEYVAFWIDWYDECKWEYLNTVELDTHDLNVPAGGLFYSVTLPLDTTLHKKICENPNLVRVRGVLSWNVLPSTTDPNDLNYYGNRVDTHIQIKPGEEIGAVMPLFNIIGGIPVDKINDVTGLTTPGASFAFNGLPVPSGAPFGGVVVVNGPTFPGNRYRIKVRNTVTNVSYYLSDSFTVVGWLPVAPYVQYTTQTPDLFGYYDFLPVEQNTLSILARFNPGTNDKLEVSMEVESVFGTFSKNILMDNIAPEIALSVDDGGDCTHYHKGDTITGHYYVNDAHLHSFSFGSSFGGGISGTNNTVPLPGNSFSIPTNAASNPCGNISLHATDKTIVNSQSVGFKVSTNYNICLQ